MRLALSGSQTVGPYFAIGMESLCSTMVPGSGGTIHTIEGSLIDANGEPIPDGVLELWQADASGRYSEVVADSVHAADGFARVKTAPDGNFRFQTVKPGSVTYDGVREQAPHIVVLVYMRGLLRNLYTRLYFPDEPANETDPILELVPPHRRHTLIAAADASGVLRWDIVMRSREGESREETVFFAW